METIRLWKHLPHGLTVGLALIVAAVLAPAAIRASHARVVDVPPHEAAMIIGGCEQAVQNSLSCGSTDCGGGVGVYCGNVTWWELVPNTWGPYEIGGSQNLY